MKIVDEDEDEEILREVKNGLKEFDMTDHEYVALRDSLIAKAENITEREIRMEAGPRPVQKAYTTRKQYIRAAAEYDSTWNQIFLRTMDRLTRESIARGETAPEKRRGRPKGFAANRGGASC